MIPSRRISVRVHLALLGFIAALPAFAIILHLGNHMADAALERAMDQERMVVSTMAAELENATGEARGLLSTLAELPAIRSADPEAARSILSAILDKAPQYSDLHLLAPDGADIASARPRTWVNMAGRKHVREAAANKGFAAGEHTFSDTGDIFPFAQAVLDQDGHVAAILVATLRLSARHRLLGEHLPGDMSLTVLDGAGIRLLQLPPLDDKSNGRPEEKRLWETVSGHPQQQGMEVMDEHGRLLLCASQSLSLAPGETPYMHIVAAIPKNDVLRGVRQYLLHDMGAMAMLAVLAVAASLILGELTVIRPITRLIRAAKSIAAGNFTTRAATGASPRELDSLGRTFDSMALALGKRDEKRRHLIEALRASRKRFRDVAASSSDWIWEMDVKGRYTFVSGRVENILGYKQEEMLGRPMFDFLIPGERERLHAIFEETVRGARPFKDLEVWHQAREGQRICLRVHGIPMLDGGSLLGFRGVCVDVTAQKAAEERILRSLGEKEVLLKEVHHRVKNNLQIISSLMSLQSQEFPGVPEVEEAFERMVGRVRSIALIHQKLYASGDFAAVEMAGYVKSLAQDIKDSHCPPGLEVAYTFRLTPIHLPLDQALPLGLVVNEMLTNAFKHAFAGMARGEISLRLGRDNGHVVLEVSDTGRGYEQDVVRGERHGLGFQLIMALADQLGGEVLFPETKKGAALRLRFPRAATP